MQCACCIQGHAKRGSAPIPNGMSSNPEPRKRRRPDTASPREDEDAAREEEEGAERCSCEEKSSEASAALRAKDADEPPAARPQDQRSRRARGGRERLPEKK